jgi:hypothetical protein
VIVREKKKNGSWPMGEGWQMEVEGGRENWKVLVKIWWGWVRWFLYFYISFILAIFFFF